MSTAHHRKKQPLFVRQQLLEVAARLASEKGVTAVTLDAVSGASGVSKGGLLHHFPSKNMLLEALFDSLLVLLDAAIEEAMRAHNAAAMVLPAHTLKGESRQFGAEPLSECAAAIEEIARQCVESRDDPSEALKLVVELRPLFQATLALLEREANPLVERRPMFGRRPAA